MIELVFGSNARAVRAYVETQQKRLEADLGDALNIERVDASRMESLSHFQQVLEASSLFHTDKLVLVRDAQKNKQIAEWIADNFTDLAERDAYIYIIESTLDKRSKLYKAAKKTKKVQEFEDLSPREAAIFVVDYAKEQKGTITSSDANSLVARVGTDQGVLVNELDKLLLFNQNITKQSIEQLTDQAPSDSIFALTDAVIQGRANGAIDIYKDLRTRQMHPLEIIATLGWQMFTLVQIKAYAHEQQNVIAKKTKIHPYVVGKNIGLVNRISKSQLASAVTVIADLEEQLKTSDASVADHSFETALLELIERLKS